MAVKKPETGATDPMMSALIAKLPPPGSSWPVDKRTSWMQMLWLTFDLVYGSDAGAAELPTFLKPAQVNTAADSLAVTAAALSKPTPAPYAFYIDKDGYARKQDATRILPSLVGGDVIYDQRGEGDFATIIWADDSFGIPPRVQLNISPAF